MTFPILKTFTRKIKRYRLSAFSLFFALCLFLTSLTGCAKTKAAETDNPEFEAFLSQLFINEVSANTLNLHYTLANPAAYGITDYEISLSDLSGESRKESKKELKQLKKDLKKFAKGSLSSGQQLTYDVLMAYLDLQINISEYDLYQEFLAPGNGVSSQLPILYAEFPFRSVRDVEDYLAILTLTDDYFTQILDFEEEKAAAGLFMSDEMCLAVIGGCEEFLDDRSENILISSFNRRIEALPDLSPEQRQEYISANKKIFDTHIVPGYQMIISRMTSLLGSGKNNWGLCNLKKGKDYYELLVQADTGCDMSIEDIFAAVETARTGDLAACKTLLKNQPDLPEQSASYAFPYRTEQEMITALQQAMLADFPAPENTNYTISYVEEALSDYLAPAFYITAPIDQYENHTIYINSAKNYSDLYYFTTLAHEGYPGHLYQTVMSYSYELPPIRSILNYPGYIEGWATYVEMISYYYAGLEENLAGFLQHNQALTLSLYATCDMGIHYYGWQEEELKKFWGAYGITDEKTIHEIARLILDEPGNYLKYYVGYLQFEDLRRSCQEKYNEDFSLTAFHEALLRMGPAPFALLEEYMDQYYDPIRYSSPQTSVTSSLQLERENSPSWLRIRFSLASSSV